MVKEYWRTVVPGLTYRFQSWMGAPWLSTRGLRRPGSDGAFYRKHPNDGEIIVGRGRRVCKEDFVILYIVNKFKSTYGILTAAKCISSLRDSRILSYCARIIINNQYSIIKKAPNTNIEMINTLLAISDQRSESEPTSMFITIEGLIWQTGGCCIRTRELVRLGEEIVVFIRLDSRSGRTFASNSYAKYLRLRPTRNDKGAGVVFEQGN